MNNYYFIYTKKIKYIEVAREPRYTDCCPGCVGTSARASIPAEVQAKLVDVEPQGVLDALTNVYVIKRTSDGTEIIVGFDTNLQGHYTANAV